MSAKPRMSLAARCVIVAFVAGVFAAIMFGGAATWVVLAVGTVAVVWAVWRDSRR